MLGDDRRLQLANLLLDGNMPDSGASFSAAYAQGNIGQKLMGKKKPGFSLAGLSDLFGKEQNAPLSLAPPSQGGGPGVAGLNLFGSAIY